MKRIIYTLLALPLLMLAACSNDDDLPQVDFDVSFSGATNVDGTFYVIQGDQFTVDAITVTPVSGTKQATIGAVSYIWDYIAFGTVIEAPFTMSLQTSNLPVGRHVLQIEASILQVDKAIGMAYFSYPVVIVESADEIPSGTEVLSSVIKDANPTIRSGTGAKFD